MHRPKIDLPNNDELNSTEGLCPAFTHALLNRYLFPWDLTVTILTDSTRNSNGEYATESHKWRDLPHPTSATETKLLTCFCRKHRAPLGGDKHHPKMRSSEDCLTEVGPNQQTKVYHSDGMYNEFH